MKTQGKIQVMLFLIVFCLSLAPGKVQAQLASTAPAQLAQPTKNAIPPDTTNPELVPGEYKSTIGKMTVDSNLTVTFEVPEDVYDLDDKFMFAKGTYTAKVKLVHGSRGDYYEGRFGVTSYKVRLIPRSDINGIIRFHNKRNKVVREDYYSLNKE